MSRLTVEEPAEAGTTNHSANGTFNATTTINVRSNLNVEKRAAAGWADPAAAEKVVSAG